MKLIKIPLCKIGKVCSTYHSDLGNKTCQEDGGV